MNADCEPRNTLFSGLSPHVDKANVKGATARRVELEELGFKQLGRSHCSKLK